MKTVIKKVIAVVICVAMILGTATVFDYNFIGSLKLLASATGENYYMINGKTVNCDSVDDGEGDNEAYIKALYNYVWGVTYTNDFSSSDNILKNVEYNGRTLNAENLNKFVKRTEPGTVLKVENITDSEIDSENGFSFFIVSYDNNGFTVFERTNERKETYYTWDSFCMIYQYSTIRFLKWPNSFFASTITKGETDYKKPERALYYDSVEMLKGDDVRWTQQKLSDIGYNVSVDGYFSKRTETAVKLFQNDFSLTVTGIVDALTADMLENPVKKPHEINLSVDKSSSSADLSIGDVLTVTWDKVDYAEGYHIFVYNNRGKLVDELDNVTTDKASFVMSASGTYTVKGYAQNKVFVGEISTMTEKVKVHNAYTVKFVDYDGTLLNKQTVAYGQDAMVPASPKREGYSFKGWDTDFNNVTSSLTVTAQYIQKSYTVYFKDNNGNNLCSPQKVLYGEAANAPDTSSIQGFVGWNKDFSSITQAMTVSAVVTQDKDNLPFSIENEKAKREGDSGGYTVTFSVGNNTEIKRIARAVVALKTTTGKFLTMTESSAFTVDAGADKALKIVVPYYKAATLVEIYIVENYNDLVPLSDVKKITNIETEDNFTGWLPDNEAPSVYYSTTDYRTEYRYKTRTTTAESYNSKTGWTLYKTTVADMIPSGWSGYSRNPVSNRDEILLDGQLHRTMDVQVASQTYTSGYNLEYWMTHAYSPNWVRHYWNYSHPEEIRGNGVHYGYKWVSVDYFNSMGWVDFGAKTGGTYSGYNMAGVQGRTEWDGIVWYNTSTTTGSYNVYRTQNYYPVYKYHFYKDSGWSDWSPNEIDKDKEIDENTTVIDVETRQTRKYEVNDPTITNTGQTRTIAGVVDNSLAGKQATLFIFKVGEASDYTNEYIGQTVISDDGSYKFNFKLREEPSVETGDFTVTLGVEGTNAVIYLDNIKAPLAKYTVNIKDYDGSVIETQLVNKGESAILPTDNPERPGYTFAGWNYSNASIFEDTDIQALYVQNEYTVVFIDWANEKFIMQTGYHYGDVLNVPDLHYLIEVEKLDSKGNPVLDEKGNVVKEFVSTANEAYVTENWKGVTDGMTVTQNMVITAESTEKTFEVNFYDYDKNIIDTQIIQYGESAKAPKLNSDDERLFISWDTNAFSCVTSSLNVQPIYCYAETVKAPTCNLKTGVYDKEQILTLSCATENSEIYYKLNDLPEEKYTEPIVIDSTAKVTFYAVAENHNPSAIQEEYYAINTSKNIYSWKYPVEIYSATKDNLGKIKTQYIKTVLVNKNTKALNCISNCNETGYDNIGYFKDSALTNQWNINTEKINSFSQIFIYMEKTKYAVNFCKPDGTVISSQTVEYLGKAVAPQNVSVEEGEVFLGWDTDDYLCVTNDITVKAIIKNESEIANISLDKTKLETITGMNYQLIATVTPEEYQKNAIAWSSDNSSVVTVDANGLIKAIAPGKATVTATLTGDEIRTAVCEVTVKSNNCENITLLNGSALKIVDGKLLGVKPKKNTVSEIFGEIDSYSLEAYSSEGKRLNESDLMETGSTINLVDNNGKIIDSITVILMGDVNEDGIVNVKDASLISRSFVNKDNLVGNAYLAADVSLNGEVLQEDISIILSYIEGKDTILS